MRSRFTAVLSALIALLAALAGLVSPPAGADRTRARLAWPPPALLDPVVVRPSEADSRLDLDPARDYVVRLPSRPLRAGGGLWIVGGRNVVVRGGEVAVPLTPGGPDRAYGIFAKDQTGTLHVEGVLLRGAGLGVGIALDQGAGATVQLENVRVAVRRRIPADRSIHPDVVQTWRGPSVLRIDRLTGHTTAQGLNLQPHEYDVQPLGIWELRHIDIAGSGGGYALWKNDWSLERGGPVGYWRIRQHDLWIAPGRRWGPAYPSRARWRPFRLGRPRGGSFVPQGLAGVRYASPGYRR